MKLAWKFPKKPFYKYLPRRSKISKNPFMKFSVDFLLKKFFNKLIFNVIFCTRILQMIPPNTSINNSIELIIIKIKAKHKNITQSKGTWIPTKHNSLYSLEIHFAFSFFNIHTAMRIKHNLNVIIIRKTWQEQKKK